MDFRSVLKALEAGNVRFIVIGGVAAVLQGVPTYTYDVDVVHALEPENCRKLIAVLRDLQAHYREHRDRWVAPREEDLSSHGHHLLATRYGPLDLLGSVGGGDTFDELRERAAEMDLGGGLHVQVLDLEYLVAMKEALGRERDRAKLPEYRRTLEERRKQRPRGDG